jgi:PAS domain S-box-containing protein
MSVLARQEYAENTEVRRLRTLYQLLAELSRAHVLEDVYHAAISSLLAATDADRAAILLFDDDGLMRFQAWHGLSAEYRQAVTGHTPWPKGTPDPKPVVVSDVMLDESLAGYRPLFVQEGIRALVFVPLALDSGVFGKFMLYYADPHEYTEQEQEVTEAIAAHVALATERKRAEMARLQSEQRLQDILDNSPTVIFLKDTKGRYILINRRYEELFHVTKSDVVGRTDHDIFPAAMAERFRQNDQRVLEAGEALSIEEYAPHDDGIHSYISIKFPLYGADGSVTGVCGIATDITQRKELEIAKFRLAAIVENSDDAIVGKDLNGIITSWNRGAERVFGYSAEEAIGRPITILAPSDRPEDIPGILARIQQGHHVHHYETRRRRKDGQIIDVSLTISPIRDASGRVVGASKIARDITQRKQAEQERALLLAREQEARRNAELLNRVSLRLTSQLDLEKLVQEVTDTARLLVGAEYGAFFRNVTDESGETYWLHTLSGAPGVVFEGFPMPRNTPLFAPTFRGEAVVRCDDVTQDPHYGKSAPHYGLPPGHPTVRSYLAAPVVARSGEVLGGLFFGHPAPGKFTESHEALVAGIASEAAIAMDNARLFEQAQWVQTELKRSNEELKRANQDLEMFAYSASHDLQEPLRTISMSAQLLERNLGAQLPAQDGKFLKSIGSAATRMESLIRDLLAYTRVTQNSPGPPAHVNASTVLGQVIESLKALIQEAGATVTADALPMVAMHEARLAQLFQNLISNAIKYRRDEPPRVHISAQEREGWIVFTVADNGIGIERRFADQIFGLFKRLHGHDEYPGSGIGLSICKRILEHYGGRIWLEKSEIGAGSTFCFAVPSRN